MVNVLFWVTGPQLADTAVIIAQSLAALSTVLSYPLNRSTMHAEHVLCGVPVYLMILTILGLATDQGFGPLAHPGYKHFVRLRIRRDGSKIQGWALGKIDPLRRSSKVAVLRDTGFSGVAFPAAPFAGA